MLMCLYINNFVQELMYSAVRVISGLIENGPFNSRKDRRIKYKIHLSSNETILHMLMQLMICFIGHQIYIIE